MVKKIPLPRGASVEKLLNAKPIVKVEKLTEEKIKTLTSSENEDEEVSSTGSSALFDFNYRVKLNKKQRHKSMIDLPAIKEVIRSDTDTLTDASVKEAVPRPKTPATHKPFAKQFKLKLLGSKSVPRKRSTSESDPEGVAAKKPCPATDQPPSKTRVSLFPSQDEENTCPNSPRKASIEPIVIESTQELIPDPSPAKLKLFSHSQPTVFPPTPPSSSSASDGSIVLGSKTTASQGPNQQKTLNSFFKKSPPIEDGIGSACVDSERAGESTQGSAIATTTMTTGKSSCGSSNNSSKVGKSAKKSLAARTPKTAKKKMVEMDRSQRNLLDYFNRC